MSDDDHQCTHLVGRDHAKRRCENTRTVGEFCGLHATHPERRIEATTISLFDYVEDAMRALGDIVRDEHMSEKSVDRIRAANSILDRTGHVPGQAITLHGANAQLDEKLNALLAERTTDAPADDDDDDPSPPGN
jgi:xanthine dehydrogenase iron-sulfur cluster and FAD-binding subunit A